MKSGSKLTYSVEFTVRSYEVDTTERCSVGTICNYFQEAAGLHARQLQFDIKDLQKKGLTWVLYRMQVKVERFPARWESVRVTTWPSGGDGVRAFRDFELWGSDGNRMGVGLSHWMVLDIRRRRPVKIPSGVVAFGRQAPPHVLPVGREALPAVDIPTSATFVTTVGFQDLDMNRHTNNVRYIEWITGYLPETCRGSRKCSEIDIRYAAEADTSPISVSSG